MTMLHISLLVCLLPAAPLADVPQPPAPARAPARAEGLPEAAQLSVWSDPDFQRRFTESYLAETDVEPTVTLIEREDLEKVLKLRSDGRVDKAMDLLEKKRNPASSAVFDYMLAGIYFEQDDLDRAGSVYQAAVDKYPKFRRAWKNLALVRMRQNDCAGALPALTRVLELGGSDALTYGMLGFAYGTVGNQLAAESAYRMALLLDPQTRDWKTGLAYSLFEQRRYADASALLGSMISEEPDRADLWLNQGNAYLGLGEPLRAAENFEVVDRLGGSTRYSLNKLGDIYYNEGVYELASQSYLRAFALDPEQGLGQALQAARRLIARGALGESKEMLGRVQELTGKELGMEGRKQLLRLQARIAVAEGAGDEQARVLEEIVQLDPLDGEALILLGQHAAQNEHVEQAVFFFERAANLEEFEAEAKLQHGRMLVAESRYGEALPLLRRSLTLRPRDALTDYVKEVERIAQTH